jgi:excisionase family DNA binding protein
LSNGSAHRTTPSVCRTSAEAYAAVFAEQRAEAQRHQAEVQRARAERSGGPADGDVWLSVETTALVLGLSTSRVLQLVHAELLPATQIGRRWWLRRSGVEQAAAARAFQRRFAT